MVSGSIASGLRWRGRPAGGRRGGSLLSSGGRGKERKDQGRETASPAGSSNPPLPGEPPPAVSSASCRLQRLLRVPSKLESMKWIGAASPSSDFLEATSAHRCLGDHACDTPSVGSSPDPNHSTCAYVTYNQSRDTSVTLCVGKRGKQSAGTCCCYGKTQEGTPGSEEAVACGRTWFLAIVACSSST